MDAAWKSYRNQVIPRDAPPIQLIECRRAFYAGAQAFYGKFMALLTPESEPTEADVRMMGALAMELEEFCQLVSRGKDGL